MAAKEKHCKHPGYRMHDGQLVCANCGEPSQTERWQENVFGVNSPEAKQAKTARSEKAHPSVNS